MPQVQQRRLLDLQVLYPKEGGDCNCTSHTACTGIIRGNSTTQDTCGGSPQALEIDIAREFWLAEKEVIHIQMVDTELDLTWGNLENLVRDAHVPFVSTEPDPLLGELDSLEDNAYAHLKSMELEILMNTKVD